MGSVGDRLQDRPQGQVAEVQRNRCASHGVSLRPAGQARRFSLLVLFSFFLSPFLLTKKRHVMQGEAQIAMKEENGSGVRVG